MEIRDGLYGAELRRAGNPHQPVLYPQEEIPFYFIAQGPNEELSLDAGHWLTSDLNRPSQNGPVWRYSEDAAIEAAGANTTEDPPQIESSDEQREELEELADVLSQPLYPQEIMAKINLAFTAGSLFHDRAAQVRILLSAFHDTESLISAALYKAWGKRPSEATLHYINTLRGVENRILEHIRHASGVSISDDELRALLEIDQNGGISRSRHGNLLGQAAELAYGIRSNPEKYRASAASGANKVDRELRRLTFRVQQMLNHIQVDPTQRLAILKQVSPIVEQGKALIEINKASTAEGSQNYDAHNQFDAVCNYYRSLK